MDASERKRRAAIVAQQNQGILPYLEAFYIDALKYAAGRSVSAFFEFDKSIDDEAKADVIMAHLQEALAHAASVSRFLWPASKSELTLARAMKLRTAFNIVDKNPLKNRNLRNVIEHFDERLDDFLLRDLVGPMMPGAIVADYRDIQGNIGYVFKLIDPANCVCIILGVECHYLPIRLAVTDVLSRAHRMDEAGSRLCL